MSRHTYEDLYELYKKAFQTLARHTRDALKGDDAVLWPCKVCFCLHKRVGYEKYPQREQCLRCDRTMCVYAFDCCRTLLDGGQWVELTKADFDVCENCDDYVYGTCLQCVFEIGRENPSPLVVCEAHNKVACPHTYNYSEHADCGNPNVRPKKRKTKSMSAPITRVRRLAEDSTSAD